jgi:hypothetical protein
MGAMRACTSLGMPTSTQERGPSQEAAQTLHHVAEMDSRTPPSRSNRPHAGQPARWSSRVTATSNALDLEPGVFKMASAREVAQSLKRSADRSQRRKSDPFRSAMSMLTFFINRAGRQVSPRQRRILEQAKDELRALYGRSRAA